MPDMSHLPRKWFSSRFARLVILMILTFLMLVPIGMVASVVAGRAWYHDTAVREVSATWGGAVRIAGPALVIPVERRWTEQVKDNDGNVTVTERTAMGDPVILLPETLDVAGDLTSSIRSRGVFEVPVFEAGLDLGFVFDAGSAAQGLTDKETLLWDGARVVLMLPDSRAFRGEAVLSRGTSVLKLEPGTSLEDIAGIQAATGDPRGDQSYRMQMTLGGAKSFMLAPAGRQTSLTLRSDWPHPSFGGDMLPQTREIADSGFVANWAVPHLVRNQPQKMRKPDQLAQLARSGFGVGFEDPVDFYHLSERAVKYGILFISLTFLTVFLMENTTKTSAHPAQLVLIGIAQSVFFLLLIALSEQIGFAAAYLSASIATVVLLSFYGFKALGLERAGWVLTGTLSLLYGVMYLILKSEDYALLAGAVLAFVAVAVTMVWTRKEDWRQKAI